MRNTFEKRLYLLQEVGGLPEPEVKNLEWLYLLREETRNSIMIEGVFISEEELERVLGGERPLKRSEEEAINYYRAALFSYGLAYQSYRSQQFLFGIPLVRQINRTVAGEGAYRKGDARITGAKIVLPSAFLVDQWMNFFEEFVKIGVKSDNFLRFLAQQHVLFETIHPFEDGNGRTGRILMNYLLISAGYPPLVLKGDDKPKDKYYKSLEQGDHVLRTLTTKPFSREDVSKALEDMKTSTLEKMISEALRTSLDRILIALLEDKRGLQLKSAKDVAEKFNFSPDSMRTLITRGKFIAVKRGKEWLTHEDLYIGKEKSKTA